MRDKTSDVTEVAALISAQVLGIIRLIHLTQNVPLSPSVTWQMSPLRVQWTPGYDGLRPGTVTLSARTLNCLMPYHASASGPNRLKMNTFGLITLYALVSELAGIHAPNALRVRQLITRARELIDNIATGTDVRRFWKICPPQYESK